MQLGFPQLERHLHTESWINVLYTPEHPQYQLINILLCPAQVLSTYTDTYYTQFTHHKCWWFGCLEHDFYFPFHIMIYMGCHPSHWLSLHFSEGLAATTNHHQARRGCSTRPADIEVGAKGRVCRIVEHMESSPSVPWMDGDGVGLTPLVNGYTLRWKIMENHHL